VEDGHPDVQSNTGSKISVSNKKIWPTRLNHTGLNESSPGESRLCQAGPGATACALSDAPASRVTRLRQSFSSGIRLAIGSIGREWDLSIVVAGVVLYAVFWSWVTILRFMALHAYVYDAGLFMQQWYDAYTVHWTPSSFFWSFTLRGLPFIFGPVALLASFPLLLSLQSTVVALGAVPIYGAARTLGLSKLVRTAISGSYLIFFPLAGASWYDLHAEAFFPTFFMFGVFFLLRRNHIPSLAFFTLAAITKYPLSLFVVAFALGAILEAVITRNRSDYGWTERRFLTILILIGGVLFVVRYVAVLVYVHVSVPGDVVLVSPIQLVSSYDETLTVALLLGPLLFLPVRLLRWAVPIAMWLGIAVYSGFWGYNYPDFVTLQYAYEITPFLFLGTIEVVSKWPKSPRPGKPSVDTAASWYRANRAPVSAVSIFACVLVLALFFQPYGPFNGLIPGTGFDMGQELDVNVTQYNEVQRVMALIPESDPYVVVQNDLPEFFPHNYGYTTQPPETNPGWLEVPGVNSGGLPYNLTYEGANGSWEPLRIDYIVADQNLQGFLEHDPSPYNLTMAQLVAKEYSTGKYGLLAELSGIILLERGYSGSPVLFQPSPANFTASDLDSSYFHKGQISITNISTGTDQWVILWRSPFITVFSGMYQVNLLLRAQATVNSGDSLEVIVAFNGSTQTDADYFYITQSNIPANDSWGWLHFSITVPAFTDAAAIFGQLNPNSRWIGSASVARLSLTLATGPAE
jgi:uncharacterized membrane protein